MKLKNKMFCFGWSKDYYIIHSDVKIFFSKLDYSTSEI
jgi:hypothetical protein